MSTDPSTTEFYAAIPDQLAVLLDALDDVAISDAERRTLAWLSGWEKHTVENLAALIVRARQTPPRTRGGERFRRHKLDGAVRVHGAQCAARQATREGEHVASSHLLTEVFRPGATAPGHR